MKPFLIMEGEIRNRVAENTNLLTFNLEDYYVEGKRCLLDIAQWLDQGFILREKEFRVQVENHDWAQYENAYVAIHCSTDAIVPVWAFMLVVVKIKPFAEKIVKGGLEDLETNLYNEVLSSLDLSNYQDKMVIVKGCSNKPVPESAYTMAVAKLLPIAKSIMYGEACSSVPLYKKK